MSSPVFDSHPSLHAASEQEIYHPARSGPSLNDSRYEYYFIICIKSRKKGTFIIGLYSKHIRDISANYPVRKQPSNDSKYCTVGIVNGENLQ